MSTPASAFVTPADLRKHLPDTAVIEAHVRTALEEDLGDGDRTAGLLPASQRSRADIITREDATLAGSAWAEMVFRLLDPEVKILWDAEDGQRIAAGQHLCALEGRSRALLSGERTAMNYLQTLSGTATRARRYADAVADLPVRLLDTRKTLPGLRAQQKYAVLCGGCHNHRQGLFDAILIKENHILAAGSIPAALKAAHDLGGGVPVEIEVESLDELEIALGAGAQLILLDNFPLDALRRAVSMARRRAQLEASGGITLETVRPIAETGVDRISVGDLTKGVEALDLSMRFAVL